MALDDANYPVLMYNDVCIAVTGADAKALEGVLEYVGDDSEWKDFMEQLEDNVDLEELGYTDDDLQEWRDSGQITAIPQEVLDAAPYTVYYAAEDANNILFKFQKAQHLVEYTRGEPHPYWAFSDWQYDVAQGDTLLGYNAWVHHNILETKEYPDEYAAIEGTKGRYTPQYQARLDKQAQARNETST